MGEMDAIRVLVFEESQSICDYLADLVEIIGCNLHILKEEKDFLSEFHRRQPDLILLGPTNQWEGVQAFSEVLDKENKKTPILVIKDGNGDRPDEKYCDRNNICFLEQGFDSNGLKNCVENLVQEARDSFYKKLDCRIIGRTSRMVQLKRHLVRLAKLDITVLITGESGTGKELIARAIHDLSHRASKPFVKVNSAALPSNLLESELFGYERGAFTGAVAKKPGKFELAHCGTLLLDEIGEIPLDMQAKLLQVLQDNEYSALGSTVNTKVDTRVLAATNANMNQMVSTGRFREDLYYRLNVVSLHVPPLRHRREDIGVLCDFFLKTYCDRYGKEYRPLDENIQEEFYRHSWPGNVRELESSIQSIIVLGHKKGLCNYIEKLSGKNALQNTPQNPNDTWIGSARSTRAVSFPTRSLKKVCKEAVRKAETEAIMDVLFHTQWNRRKAANYLKISYKALLNKIKEYGIEKRYRKLGKKEGQSESQSIRSPNR